MYRTAYTHTSRAARHWLPVVHQLDAAQRECARVSSVSKTRIAQLDRRCEDLELERKQELMGWQLEREQLVLALRHRGQIVEVESGELEFGMGLDGRFSYGMYGPGSATGDPRQLLASGGVSVGVGGGVDGGLGTGDDAAGANADDAKDGIVGTDGGGTAGGVANTQAQTNTAPAGDADANDGGDAASTVVGSVPGHAATVVPATTTHTVGVGGSAASVAYGTKRDDFGPPMSTAMSVDGGDAGLPPLGLSGKRSRRRYAAAEARRRRWQTVARSTQTRRCVGCGVAWRGVSWRLLVVGCRHHAVLTPCRVDAVVRLNAVWRSEHGRRKPRGDGLRATWMCKRTCPLSRA